MHDKNVTSYVSPAPLYVPKNPVTKMPQEILSHKSVMQKIIHMLHCLLAGHIWQQQYRPCKHAGWGEDTACKEYKVCMRCEEAVELDAMIKHQKHWVYKDTASCLQELKCIRCGYVSHTNEFHDWGNTKYESPTSCKQTQTCKRCNKIKRVEEHTWGNWKFESSHSCQKIRTCEHCNTIQTGTIVHEWGESKYESPDSCNRIKVCNRCGEIQKGKFSHEWGEWHYKESNPCQRERICNHCHQKWQDTDHKWGAWKYTDPELCLQKRICERCQKEEEKTAHQWEDWETLSLQQNGKKLLYRRCKRCKTTEETEEMETETMGPYGNPYFAAQKWINENF